MSSQRDSSQNLKRRLQERINSISAAALDRENYLERPAPPSSSPPPPVNNTTSVVISNGKPIIRWPGYKDVTKSPPSSSSSSSSQKPEKAFTPTAIRQLLKQAKEQGLGNGKSSEVGSPAVIVQPSTPTTKVMSKFKRASSPIPYRRAVSQQNDGNHIDMTKSPTMQRKFIDVQAAVDVDVTRTTPRVADSRRKRSNSTGSATQRKPVESVADSSWKFDKVRCYVQALVQGKESVDRMPASFFRHLTVAFLAMNRFHKYCQTYEIGNDSVMSEIGKTKKMNLDKNVGSILGSNLMAALKNIGLDMGTIEILSICHVCAVNEREFKLAQVNQGEEATIETLKTDLDMFKVILDQLPVSVSKDSSHIQSVGDDDGTSLGGTRKRSKSMDSLHSTSSKGPLFPMDVIRADNRRRTKDLPDNDLLYALDTSDIANCDKKQLHRIELQKACESGWCSLFGNEKSLDADNDDDLSIRSDLVRGRSRTVGHRGRRGNEIISSPMKRRGDFGVAGQDVVDIVRCVFAALREHKAMIDDVFYVVGVEFPTGWIQSKDLKRVFQVLGVPHITVAEVNCLRKYFFLQFNNQANEADSIPRRLSSDFSSAVELDTVVTPLAGTIASALETVQRTEYVLISDIKKAIINIQNQPVVIQEKKVLKMRSKSVTSLSSTLNDFLMTDSVIIETKPRNKKLGRVASARQPPVAPIDTLETGQLIKFDEEDATFDQGDDDCLIGSNQCVDDGMMHSNMQANDGSSLSSSSSSSYKLRRFLNERRFKGIKTDEMTNRIQHAIYKRRQRSRSLYATACRDDDDDVGIRADDTIRLEDDFQHLFHNGSPPTAKKFDLIELAKADRVPSKPVPYPLIRLMQTETAAVVVDNDAQGLIDDLTKIEEDACYVLDSHISNRFDCYMAQEVPESPVTPMIVKNEAEAVPHSSPLIKIDINHDEDEDACPPLQDPLMMPEGPATTDHDEANDDDDGPKYQESRVSPDVSERSCKSRRTPPSIPIEVNDGVSECELQSTNSHASLDAQNIFFPVAHDEVKSDVGEHAVANDDDDDGLRLMKSKDLLLEATRIIQDKLPLDAFGVSMARILLAAGDGIGGGRREGETASPSKANGGPKKEKKPIAKSANSEKEREDILALVLTRN